MGKVERIRLERKVETRSSRTLDLTQESGLHCISSEKIPRDLRGKDNDFICVTGPQLQSLAPCSCLLLSSVFMRI